MNCKLRKLKPEDAPLMLEWMHDEQVTSGLRRDFSRADINTCLAFIKKCQDNTEDIHLAVVSAKDEYLGTVSLKHIKNSCAEFAIVIRRKAMGKNIAATAMKQIIEYGFSAVGLKEIYWCVVRADKRAVKFYEKNNYARFTFSYEEQLQRSGEYNIQEYNERDWFRVMKNM